jgi:hypothetical protein
MFVALTCNMCPFGMKGALQDQRVTAAVEQLAASDEP